MDNPNRLTIPWPTEQGPLTFDCLVAICKFLQEPEDLVRFSLACREFYHVACTGSLWRVHCLHRWVVCNLIKVPEGVNRWRRYYVYRRQLEERMGRGQPSKDYYALTLRGHNTEITKMMYMKRNVDVDSLAPINITSYDRSGVIIAWGIQHAENKGDQVWQGKTSERRSAMACSPDSTTLAYPSPAGDSIIFLNALTWKENKRPELKLSSMTSASGNTVLVTSIMYGEIPGKLPKPFLMVGRGADTQCSRIEIWDVEDELADKPVVILDTMGLVPTNLQLSTNNILAVCGDCEFEESRSSDVKIWDLTMLPVDGSLVKEHIVIRSKRDVMNIRWWNGRCDVLAIGATGEGALTVWELQPYLDQLRPSKSKEKKKQLFTKPVVQQQTVSFHYTSANYTVSDFCCSEPVFPMASTTFYLLFGGSQKPELNMLPVGESKHVSLHVEHSSPITDISATEFGVFTCSRDFSIRVFKWQKGKTPDEPPILNSLYTLLGGSVMRATCGFSAVDHSYSSVAGISGEKIKIYIFQR